MDALVDRDTALGIVAGTVLGAKGFTFWTALGLSGLFTALTVVTSRARPDLCPPRERGGAGRFAIDTATTMAAWWAGKELFPHPARQLAATTQPRG